MNIQALYKQRADLRAFLEIILSVSTVTIFLLFALKPTALTIISLYNQIQEKKATLAGLTQKIADLQTANNVFTQSQNFIPHVDAAISNNPQPNINTEQLLALAAKDNVSVLGVSAGDVLLVGTTNIKKPPSDLKPLPDSAGEISLSVSLKGDYPSLITLLKDIENLRTAVKLDVLGVTASQSDQTKAEVMIISGRIPYVNK